MKCYVCGHDRFKIYFTLETTVDKINDVPVYQLTVESQIQTILCAKCGVMQYCEGRKDPWFTDQVSLVWDDEKQMLVEKKKEKVSLSTDELTKLLREYVNQGGKLDEIIKKKEEK